MKHYSQKKFGVTAKQTAHSIKMFIMMLLLVLTACCSKDHSDSGPTPEPEPQPQPQPVEKDMTRLTAKLITPEGIAVWTEGDSLKMFSVSAMQQLCYHLTAGAGTANGSFALMGSSEIFDNDPDLYVITASDHIYGIAATETSIPMLAEKIPVEYSMKEVHALPSTFRMPAPYWGRVTISADGTPALDMCGLTALLSIDLTRLPHGTHAILLTTHNGFLLNNESVNGGGGEPLTGTFDTVFTDGATLEANSIFVKGDSLRVSFFSEEDVRNNNNWTPPVLTGKIFLPIIVNTYKQLHVIAITGDDNVSYSWEGTELQVFNNRQFTLNSLVEL